MKYILSQTYFFLTSRIPTVIITSDVDAAIATATDVP